MDLAIRKKKKLEASPPANVATLQTEDTNRDDGLAAEAVSEESERNASGSENHQKIGLQRAELRRP